MLKHHPFSVYLGAVAGHVQGHRDVHQPRDVIRRYPGQHKQMHHRKVENHPRWSCQKHQAWTCTLPYYPTLPSQKLSHQNGQRMKTCTPPINPSAFTFSLTARTMDLHAPFFCWSIHDRKFFDIYRIKTRGEAMDLPWITIIYIYIIYIYNIYIYMQ